MTTDVSPIEPADAGGPEPSFVRRLLPKLVISLVLGGILAWLVKRSGVDIVPTDGASWAAVHWWAVPAYAALAVVTHVLRATRWRFLIAPLKRVPLKEVILLNFIGFFAIFALPLRLGEFARPALTKLRHGISVSAGLGTVAVERVLDGLVTSFCVAWALFALPRLEVAPDDEIVRALPAYGYAALTLFGGAFVALAFFLWKRDWAVRLTEVIVGFVSPKLATFLADKVSGVADGVRSIGDPKLGVGFLVETLAYWASNAAGMWVLALGCGIDMSFGQAVGVMGILAIGILLPAGPGLFGSFQLAVSTALRLYFASHIVTGVGAVYVFLMFVVQAVMMTIAGVVPLLAMNISLSSLVPRTEMPAEADGT